MYNIGNVCFLGLFKMNIKNLFLCVFIILLTACGVKYNTTQSGVRVKNPKVFKYRKAKYTQENRKGIDTNAIYVKKMIRYPWADDPKEQPACCDFMRFFPDGQVIIVKSALMPCAAQINDAQAGIPGYYITKGTKIKIEKLTFYDGGTGIGFYFGRLQDDGSLKIYEQTSTTYFNSYFFTELFDKGYFSIWEKAEVENMAPLTLSW